MTAAVLDAERLGRFAEECGDVAFVRQHLGRYLRLLPGRVAAVADRLARRDVDATVDRLLSLRTASALVGAGELECLSRRLEGQLGAGCWDAAHATCRRLAEAADRADVAFTEHALGEAGGTGGQPAADSIR